MVRAPCCEKIGLNRGPWTQEEDMILIAYVQNFGHANWRALPKQAGLLRCGKSCRLRWVNYLKPDIKRGNFTEKEEETIIQMHEVLGNKWSAIAAQLPGRTDNEIKNVWHSHLKKRSKQRTSTANQGIERSQIADDTKEAKVVTVTVSHNHKPGTAGKSECEISIQSPVSPQQSSCDDHKLGVAGKPCCENSNSIKSLVSPQQSSCDDNKLGVAGEPGCENSNSIKSPVSSQQSSCNSLTLSRESSSIIISGNSASVGSSMSEDESTDSLESNSMQTANQLEFWPEILGEEWSELVEEDGLVAGAIPKTTGYIPPPFSPLHPTMYQDDGMDFWWSVPEETGQMHLPPEF